MIQHEVDDQATQSAVDAVDISQLPTESFVIGTYSYTRDRPIAQEHLDELHELVLSYGSNVLGSLVCPLKKPNPRTYLGEGKIEELNEQFKLLGVKLVVFDCELSPGQQRNLESLFKISVADRTEIILGVFAKHARSRESRLQVELAQIQHHMPRLKRLWTHLSRQRGGGVNQKGEGETQIEIDRRILKKRVEILKDHIESIQQTRDTKQIARDRSKIPSFAIVGYTNAGKSTLMNAMTSADVLVEDKLFATLDTTTRKYRLPAATEVLVIDTVGFIRKLPHLVVAAFRSTLQEAAQADILLHLIDGSHPQVKEHIEATAVVLKELKAQDKQRLMVFNKLDRMSPDQVMALRVQYPAACFVSALTQEGLGDLAQAMEAALSGHRQAMVLKIPQERFDLVTHLYQVGKVRHIEYVDNDMIVDAELPAEDASRLAGYAYPPIPVESPAY